MIRGMTLIAHHVKKYIAITDNAMMNRLVMSRFESFEEDIQFYAEDRTVAANWNRITVSLRDPERWSGEHTVFDPDLMVRWIERCGFDVAWSDMVTSCDDCSRMIETEPTGFYWKPA